MHKDALAVKQNTLQSKETICTMFLPKAKHHMKYEERSDVLLKAKHHVCDETMFCREQNII